MSREELREAFTDIFTPIPTTLDLIRGLKDKGYTLGLLSNTSEWDYLYGIKAVEVFPLFDHVTVSFPIGFDTPHVGRGSASSYHRRKILSSAKNLLRPNRELAEIRLENCRNTPQLAAK